MKYNKNSFFQGKLSENINYYKNFKKYVEKSFSINNYLFTISIIGDSHVIISKELDYMEFLVCKDLDFTNRFEILKEEIGNYYNFKYETNYSQIETMIQFLSNGQDLKQKNPDLLYEFSDQGITAVKINKNIVETYHNYPEFEKLVYTKSKITIKNE